VDELTTPATFTTGLVCATATGAPAEVSTDAKPYSQRAAAADGNVAIRTDPEPPAQRRDSRESGPSLAVGAHLPARYLRTPIRFDAYHGQVAGDVKFVARGSGPYLIDNLMGAIANVDLRLPPEFTHRKWTEG